MSCGSLIQYDITAGSSLLEFNYDPTLSNAPGSTVINANYSAENGSGVQVTVKTGGTTIIECDASNNCRLTLNSSFSLPQTEAIRLRLRYCNRTLALENATADTQIMTADLVHGDYEYVIVQTSEEVMCSPSSVQITGCNLSTPVTSSPEAESSKEESSVSPVVTRDKTFVVLLLLCIGTLLLGLATLGATTFLVVSAVAKARCRKK
jgi:hypothetical protein